MSFIEWIGNSVFFKCLDQIAYSVFNSPLWGISKDLFNFFRGNVIGSGIIGRCCRNLNVRFFWYLGWNDLLYDLCNLIIFGFLWSFRRHKKYDGQLFWLYVLLYGVTRSFIEVFRGDFRGSAVFGILSVSQHPVVVTMQRRSALRQKLAVLCSHWFESYYQEP